VAAIWLPFGGAPATDFRAREDAECLGMPQNPSEWPGYLFNQGRVTCSTRVAPYTRKTPTFIGPNARSVVAPTSYVGWWHFPWNSRFPQSRPLLSFDMRTSPGPPVRRLPGNAWVTGLKIPVSGVQFSPCPPFLSPAKRRNPALGAAFRVSTAPGILTMGWDGLLGVVRGHRTPVRTPGSCGRASHLRSWPPPREAPGGDVTGFNAGRPDD
jgi:hypothetical protein